MNNFLKKILPALCATMPLFSMAADTVPAVRTRCGTVNKAGQLRAIGIKLDNEQITFAFADWDKASGDSISVYWNSDNDKTTGCFPGNVGGDIQFNLNPAKKYLQVVRWFEPANKRQIAFYPDDYLVEEMDGIIFFAIRKGGIDSASHERQGQFLHKPFQCQSAAA